MKTEIEIINEAGRILLDPKAHCTSGVYAEDNESQVSAIGGDKACKFCVYGAMAHVNGTFIGLPNVYSLGPQGQTLAEYIMGHSDPKVCLEWDTGTEEFRLACAQRMADYKGLP